MSGLHKHNTVSKVLARTAFCELLEKWQKRRKIEIFQLCIAKCCREVLEKSVVGKCCREVLEKSVVERWCKEELENRVGEKCWREVLEKRVVEMCWRRVL